MTTEKTKAALEWVRQAKSGMSDAMNFPDLEKKAREQLCIFEHIEQALTAQAEAHPAEDDVREAVERELKWYKRALTEYQNQYGSMLTGLYNQQYQDEDIEASVEWAREQIKHTRRDHNGAPFTEEASHLNNLIRAATQPRVEVVTWRTDTPPERGYYMVTTANESNGRGKRVELSRYGGSGWYADHDGRVVIAWRAIPAAFGLKIVEG